MRGLNGTWKYAGREENAKKKVSQSQFFYLRLFVSNENTNRMDIKMEKTVTKPFCPARFAQKEQKSPSDRKRKECMIRPDQKVIRVTWKTLNALSND